MRLEPDFQAAADEQRVVATLARTVLSRAGLPVPDYDALCFPGLIAVAHDVQRLPADATADQLAACMAAGRAALAAGALSRQRARGLNCAVWEVDLPPVESHLVAALSRALAQIPARPDRVVDVHVADWTDSERTVFRAAARLLAQVWPQMLTELSVCIRQVALLRGYGITGFSDFTVHGAIFVNEERLTFGDRDSLPGPVRLAESLIHEGAHNRCFSAAVRDPFLPADNSDARVSTPLRADPRPLWGLFQQLVVLCRSTHLYQRLGPAAPIQGRYEVLITQARQALGTLRAHADQLTDHGRAVLAEASTAVTASSCPT